VRPHGPWVLVTDGGNGQTRDAVAAVRGLAAGGYRPAITLSQRSWLNGSSKYATRRVRVPPLEDERFAEGIRAEATRNGYLAVIPASEAALLALGVSRPELSDKLSLAEAASAVGLMTPPSRVFASTDDLLAAADELEYPVVIKPLTRRHRAWAAVTSNDLTRGMVGDGIVVVQPLLPGPLHAISGVVWDGRLIAAVHEHWLRTWPPRSGLPSAAMTVRPDPEIEDRLVALLAGYEGLFSAQMAGTYLFDVNLRIHSSHALAVSAGVNLISLYCDLVRGRHVPVMRAKPGAFYRWLEGDVRYVVDAIRAGTMGLGSACWMLLPRWQTAHSIESIRDPLPMVRRIVDAASNRWSRLLRVRPGAATG
jgi:predicted ATP-grasp superfamily ATP-dependent carboligase